MAEPQIDDRSGRLWIEEGEQRRGLIAEVAPLIPVQRTDSFAVPEEMALRLQIGRRVRVPVGARGRLVEGFVVGVDEGPWDHTLRPIAETVDAESFLTPELVALGREISVHYACPLGKTLKAVTPEDVRRARGLKNVRYLRLTEAGRRLLGGDGSELPPKRATVLRTLAEGAEPVAEESVLTSCGVSRSLLRTLVRSGLVAVEVRKESVPDAEEPTAVREPDYELNEEQRNALAVIGSQIARGGFGVTLVHGVSGSGKTEVYIHAIRRVLVEGKQAILLVPEIVLTTQLVVRLAERFERVAVLHSRLTGAERSRMWRRIAEGERNVVIGTRSAVFAPCPRLGLICVDEEQESSYKNLQAPRFHVRDVAIMRGKLNGIPVVLGSATPAVETFYHSEHRPDYRKVVLRRRVRDNPLPKVYLVDMRDELAQRKGPVVLSEPMRRMLGEALDRGEQAVLLVNRRGLAHRIFCPACKTRVTCPNCQVGLVAHRATGQSVCHYCLARFPTPTHCANVNCRQPLLYLGLGTQRVEDVLAERFPRVRIARVDSDTMTHRARYQRVIEDFSARRIDVLVGTQMVAKGLDFPHVSFVGVVDADATGLTFDFRAQEKLFQLITQVAGRAGRADTPGRVVVQTAAPDLPALRYAVRHDYEGFVRSELAARRKIGLPPFRRLARLVVSHKRHDTTCTEAEALADRIRETIGRMNLPNSDVLGPNPCAIARLRGKYRYDLLIRTADASRLRMLMARLETDRALRTSATLIVDVDPVSMH
ncbi:MAG: primosomal protein N' [Planctomycetota bacterium]|nr:MAG: primosomal protein N' [Planctomycetota bacterium]